jgi:hypothetical protein
VLAATLAEEGQSGKNRLKTVLTRQMSSFVFCLRHFAQELEPDQGNRRICVYVQLRKIGARRRKIMLRLTAVLDRLVAHNLGKDVLKPIQGPRPI